MLIAFLVGGYYPNFSANGNCISKIANRIDSKHRVIVISQKKQLNQSRYDKYNNQSIVRITTNKMDKRLLIDLRLSNTSGIKHLFWKFILRLHQVVSLAKLIINKYGLDRQLIKEYYKELSQLSESPDIIIPVCFPVEGIYATLKYFKNTVHKPVVLPILLDRYSENDTFFRFALNKRLHSVASTRLEEETFKISKKIFYVDNWDYYISKMKKNKEKVVRIEHPLIEEILSSPRRLECKKQINIVYQGECNREMRPPEMTLEFFNRLQLYDIDFKLHFFSYGNSIDVIKRFNKEHKEIMEFYGHVDKITADEYFIDSDISLIIGNKNPSVVPSKIFECLSLGKPILYFYNSIDDKPIKILKQYPIVHLIKQGDFSIKTLKDTIIWIMKYLDKRLPFEQISELYKEATPNYVYERIKDAF
jgi:hypothetical protein